MVWLKAEWFAGRMLSGADALDLGAPELPIGQVSITQTAISVMGVYLLVSAVPQLFQTISLIAARGYYEQIPAEFNASTLAHLVSISTQLSIGLSLVFGASGVARVIHWARRVGVAKESETT